MSDEDGLIAAVRAAPADPLPKLVYADWLDEHGRPDRAAYLRLVAGLRSDGQGRADRWAEMRVLRGRIDGGWLGRTGTRLHLLAAIDGDERMGELEHFIEYWYGPWEPELSDPPDELDRLPVALPGVLRRFYAFAGQWPSVQPGYDAFFTGGSGHHLWVSDDVTAQPDGRLNFFMEYQGDWNALTLPGQPDPPVWVEGVWEDDGSDDDNGGGHKSRQVANALSAFLVTHVLMTTIYEAENSRANDAHRDGPLVAWFRAADRSADLIWDAGAEGGPLYMYAGQVYLTADGVLVRSDDGYFNFAAVHPAAVALIESHRRR